MKIKQEIRDRQSFPACIRSFDVLQGICVGGCINSSDSIIKQGAAHAHADKNDDYHGWICLRFKYQLKEKFVLLHEVAHLLVPDSHHGKPWRQKVVEIGGTIKPMLSCGKGMGAPYFYPGYRKGGKYYYPSKEWVRKHYGHKIQNEKDRRSNLDSDPMQSYNWLGMQDK